MKPFAIEDLLARIRDLLRRAQPSPPALGDPEPQQSRHADLVADPATRGSRGSRTVPVTLPHHLLEEVDRAALELKRSRSALVRQALVEWLKQAQARRFEELLADGYRESAEEASALANDALVQQSVATAAGWQWDE